MRRHTLAKALDQILAEIDAGYNPQRQSIQARLDALPAQADSEIAGLNATKDQAFTDILGGARDRGMGFSGVPLAEQAKYTASQFLPAVARVRQSQNESKQSLFDALNNINLDQRKYATSLYQQELDREEQARQYNESLAEQRRQAAAAAKSNPYAGLFSAQNTAASSNQQSQPKIDANTQKAYNDVQGVINSNDTARIQREYEAIKKSAGYGNAYDQLKLQLLNQLYPQAGQRSGQNTVPLVNSAPRTISLNPQPYTGLSVGVARPGSIQVR